MQQELIEMLDKMVKYFDEISSDSYYYRETAAILNEAEKLVEKAKNSAKEPAVPMSESQRADMICAVAAICTGTSSRTVAATAIEWTERYYGIATHAAPSQPVMQGEPVAQVSDLFPSIRTKLYEMGFEPESPLYTAPADGPATPPYHRDLWGISHAIARINEAEYIATFTLDQDPVTLTDSTLADIQDRLVSISGYVADQDDRAAQAILKESYGNNS